MRLLEDSDREVEATGMDMEKISQLKIGMFDWEIRELGLEEIILGSSSMLIPFSFDFLDLLRKEAAHSGNSRELINSQGFFECQNIHIIVILI